MVPIRSIIGRVPQDPEELASGYAVIQAL